MFKNLFEIVLFLDKIEIKKIEFEEKTDFCNEWHTGTKYTKDLTLKEDSYQYLIKLFRNNLENYNIELKKNNRNTIKCDYIEINRIWKNYYTPKDFQELHIHGGDFSFIINESVKKSKTIFLNPSWKHLQFTKSRYIGYETKYYPNLKPLEIVIFPGFLEHYVLSNNQGTTIAGNFVLS